MIQSNNYTLILQSSEAVMTLIPSEVMIQSLMASLCLAVEEISVQDSVSITWQYNEDDW